MNIHKGCLLQRVPLAASDKPLCPSSGTPKTSPDFHAKSPKPIFSDLNRELKIIYHHHPESQEGKSSDRNSGSIQPYGRYGNAGKTGKTISTITILWPVKAIFEKRAATVEVDIFVSPAQWVFPQMLVNLQSISIDFLFFSIGFNQLQSIIISLNQFGSVKNGGIH